MIYHSKPFFDKEDYSQIQAVLNDMYVTSGERCRQFGNQMSKQLKKNWGIATNSGTDAMTLALKSLRLKKNSNIALSAYMCSAPLDSIAKNHCKPILIDINPETFSINNNLAIESHADVILGAHMFGIQADFSSIPSNLLIEDCAQSLETNVHGKKPGESGRFAICSFYGTKLMTTGHGGMLCGDDKKLFQQCENLLNHDNQEIWQEHEHSRLSDFAASLGLAQLKKLPKMIKRRQEIASRYFKALGIKSSIKTSSFSRFILFSENRDRTITNFQNSGIEAKKPIYLPLYQLLKISSKQFPNTEAAYKKILSIPLYPSLTENEIQQIEEKLDTLKNELMCWTST